MVDAAALFDREAGGETKRGASATAETDFSASVCFESAAYAAFCGKAVFAPSQSPAWASAWLAEAKPDAIFATLNNAGQPVLALALEVVPWNGCRIARFMGGRHANGNFPACLPGTAQLDAAGLPLLTRAMRAARPDIDLIAFERLAPELDGVRNPLLELSSFASPNPGLAVDLDGGFDALLARTSGKRKRKKYRSQLRKFEAVGGVKRIEARTHQETDRLLDAFFAMKTFRFQKAGIRNVFAEAEVQTFFRTLFADALGAERPPFVLHGLEVAGKLRAITGSSRSHGRITCEFGAIAEDDVAQISPGDFLFFENIKEACDQGLAIYDFGVGDEPYKRLWCDIKTEHRDVLVPLTIKGRVLVRALSAFASAKACIKNNPTLWKLVKRVRRQAVGTQVSAEDRSDG